MPKSRAERLADACEVMETAACELIACAERLAMPGPHPEDIYQKAGRRRALLAAARSYVRALDAVRRRPND